jgi:hypothetical protein
MTQQFLTGRPSADRTVFPLGVADRDAGVAWVAASGGGIEALRVDDGASVWRSDQGDQAIIAVEGIVVVDTGAGLAGLDAGSGALRFTSGPIAWTRPERRYTGARVEAGILRADYFGAVGPLGGPPRRESDTAPVDGTVTLDLTTGQASVDERPAVVDALAWKKESWPAGIDENMTIWPLAGGLRTPWRFASGSRAAVLEQRAKGERWEMVLRTWAAAGTPADQAVLATAAHPMEAPAYVTPDGEHVVIVTCAAGAVTCRAAVHAVAGARAVAEIDLPASIEEPLVLLGSTLYVLLTTPRVVRAIDLPSGRARWDHPVRELPQPGPIAP